MVKHAELMNLREEVTAIWKESHNAIAEIINR